MNDATLGPAPDATIRNDVFRGLFRDRSLLGLIGAVEAALGLIAMGFFSFVVIVVGVLLVVLNSWMYGYPKLEPPVLILMAVGWVVVAWLEWRSLLFFCDGLERAPHPVPVHVATRLTDRGPAARVLIALWWIAHAGAIVLVAGAFIQQIKTYNPSTVEKVLQIGIPLALLFGTAFAMNTHLLIAVYALTRSERLVRGCYRARILLDLAVVFVVPRLQLSLVGSG
jgi:hypothetical protein